MRALSPAAGLLPLLVLLCIPFLLAACGGDGDDTASDTAYADSMAEQHQHDSPTATALVMEPMIPVRTETVQYGTVGGQALTGYLAVPVRPDSVAAQRGLAAGDSALPALIVVHEWWGLNGNIEAMTRRLAGEGYRALAVDLYNGQVAQTPEEARTLLQQAGGDAAMLRQNMVAAYRHLKQAYGAPRVAVLGWCFGGAQALQAALALPDELDAAVIYYGRLVDDRQQLQALEMPILGLFGGQDASIPTEGVRAFESTLAELGKDAEIHIYENAGHAFANPSGQNFVPEAARDAWDRTTAFLNEHLY